MLNRLIDELCGRNVLSYSPPATGVSDLVDVVPPTVIGLVTGQQLVQAVDLNLLQLTELAAVLFEE
jgi:hypothetical protein